MKKIYAIWDNGVVWCQIWQSEGLWVLHWPEYEAYRHCKPLRLGLEELLVVLYAKNPECARQFLKEWMG